MHTEINSDGLAPVYSKIKHTRFERRSIRNLTEIRLFIRSPTLHDYVDIDSTSTDSQKTEYCKMEPQSPLLLRYCPPQTSPPVTAHAQASPISRTNGSFYQAKNLANRSAFVKRSFSAGPVNDIYSYRNQREKTDNYINNRILPEDLVEEQMYGGWCSTSRKSLLNNCDGSCSLMSGSITNRKSIEDLSLSQKCFLKIRPFLAVCMAIIGILAGNFRDINLVSLLLAYNVSIGEFHEPHQFGYKL